MAVSVREEWRPCRAPHGLGLVLDELGLSNVVAARDALREPRPWLTIEEYFAIWDALEAAVGDPTFGARLGRRAVGSIREPAFLACLGSRDLGDALERMSRYKRTLSPERLELLPAVGGIELRYGWPVAPRSPPPILVEAELAFLLQLARTATGQSLSDARVHSTRNGVDLAPLREAFAADVRLGATEGTLWLPAAARTAPFATFNPSLLAMLDPALTADTSTIGDDIVARARRALRMRLGGDALTLEALAADLDTTARTLQRRLRGTGTTFAKLLGEVRLERASFYLRESDLSFAEIAFLLGFDNVSSFFRAFARWTGGTPGAYRDVAIGNRRGANGDCSGSSGASR